MRSMMLLWVVVVVVLVVGGRCLEGWLRLQLKVAALG